jgi:dTDP-glucose 4,6-dehydratase
MGKKYCILGGGGSFGIHTAKYLLDHASPEKVISIGRNPLRERCFSLGIEDYDKFQYHTRHINYEMDLLLEILDKEKPEIIINYAAQGEGAVSWKNSWRFFETNSMALAKLTEELQKRDWMKQFIQIGTSEMYGSVARPSKEDDPIQPSSPYAASKVAFDMHLVSIYRFLKFPMNIIRPSNAYCPGQLLHRIIPKTIWCGLSDTKLPLHGGGRAEKSYIHARDLARAIHMVAENDTVGEIYNVGPKEPTAIIDVVKMTCQAMGIPFDKLVQVTGDRLGQDSRYWLDSSKIRDKFGWEQEISWEEGLKEMVEWGHMYKDQILKQSTDYVMRG